MFQLTTFDEQVVARCWAIISEHSCHQAREEVIFQLIRLNVAKFVAQCEESERLAAAPIDPLFYRIYDKLSERGHCDSAGGMECRRVHQEWVGAGKPKPISSFIRERANAI